MLKSLHINLYKEFYFTPHNMQPCENSLRENIHEMTIPL